MQYRSVRSILHKLSNACSSAFDSLNPSTNKQPDEKDEYVAPICPEGMDIGPPDFVGIGAQKSGTSYWFALLSSHPTIFVPDFRDKPYPDWYNKERHFFDKFYKREFSQKDIDEYYKWFPRPEGKVTGEWTPRYCCDIWTAPLLAQAAPDAKLIMMVRDPVNRFASGMAHSEQYGSLSASSALNHYQRGLYARQLDVWLKYFPRDRFLVLQFEKCVANPNAKIEETFQFLEIRKVQVKKKKTQKKINRKSKKSKYVVPSKLREVLIDGYAEDVLELKKIIPSINLRLWKNFSYLA